MVDPVRVSVLHAVRFRPMHGAGVRHLVSYRIAVFDRLIRSRRSSCLTARNAGS